MYIINALVIKKQFEYAAVSEWSNVHAWKACERSRSEGSNPSCCAIKKTTILIYSCFFIWDSNPLGMRSPSAHKVPPVLAINLLPASLFNASRPPAALLKTTMFN